MTLSTLLPFSPAATEGYVLHQGGKPRCDTNEGGAGGGRARALLRATSHAPAAALRGWASPGSRSLVGSLLERVEGAAHLGAALHLGHRRLVALKVGLRRLGRALGQLLAPSRLGKLGLDVCSAGMGGGVGGGGGQSVHDGVHCRSKEQKAAMLWTRLLLLALAMLNAGLLAAWRVVVLQPAWPRAASSCLLLQL